MLVFLLVAVGIVCAIVAGSNYFIVSSTHDYRYARIEDIPERPVGIVFAAGVKKNQTPSGQLAARIDGGMALYRVGKVHRLLFTGNGRVHNNEVGAMLKYAIAHGFDPHAITIDGEGFDTYESCYRAKHVFGIRSAVLVTQSYHLGRAVFLCRSMGIDVAGFALPDWGNFSADMMRRTILRETFARVKAVWEGLVLRPSTGNRP
jgi:vancomycin permeability regulator SanA